MPTQRQIDSPLSTSYTIAALTSDHADRMFVALNPYLNQLMWSRKYRPAAVYETANKAADVMREIIAGNHPDMIAEKAGVDLSTMCVLETEIRFKYQKSAAGK
jgi:hypothetical protein